MELVDVVADDGTPTGVVKSKADVHRDGDLHRSVHVWIATPRGMLVQLRSIRKENNPGLWDVSVAGHISAGENAISAALREAEEEIGLVLEWHELRHVATIPERAVLNDGRYIENELHEIFIVRRDVDVNSLQLQESEVDAVTIMPFEEYLGLDVVPHPAEYELIRALL